MNQILTANIASECEFSFRAGVLLRKNIRTILKSEWFFGRNIRWMEEKGWLESLFRIRGEYFDVKAVETRLDTYAKALDAT